MKIQIISFLALALISSCAKKRTLEHSRNSNQAKGPSFEVQIENINAGKKASEDQKKLSKSATEKKPILVTSAVSAIRELYKGDSEEINLKKAKVIESTRVQLEAEKLISEKGVVAAEVMKVSLFANYKKALSEILYNKDAVNIFDIDKTGRFQCSSGTWNYWYALLTLFPNMINERNLVNIYTAGHILPGEIKIVDNQKVLIGYETTVLGKGVVDFGAIKDLRAAIRIVDLKHDLVVNSLKLVGSQGEVLRDEVLKKTADLYGINLETLEKLVDSKAVGEIKELNQSIFSFGTSNPKGGDQKLDEKADVVSVSAYTENGGTNVQPEKLKDYEGGGPLPGIQEQDPEDENLEEQDTEISTQEPQTPEEQPANPIGTPENSTPSNLTESSGNGLKADDVSSGNVEIGETKKELKLGVYNFNGREEMSIVLFQNGDGELMAFLDNWSDSGKITHRQKVDVNKDGVIRIKWNLRRKMSIFVSPAEGGLEYCFPSSDSFDRCEASFDGSLETGRFLKYAGPLEIETENEESAADTEENNTVKSGH